MVVRVENSLRFAGFSPIAQNPPFVIWEHEVAGSNPVAPTKDFKELRVGDEHVARLNALAEASGFTRGEILRRALLNAEIPSARARQEVQDLLRIQREQNRLGGLLKKALTEREEKAVLRRTLVEVERNAAELRRVIAHLVRSR